MTAPAAFKATFSDFRLVKGRKVAQIVVEVPIEEADHALLALGGIPRPDIARWVAVAQISPEALDQATPQSVATGSTPAEPKQPVASVGDRKEYTLANRIGMTCADPDFQKWLSARYNGTEVNKDTVGPLVRAICGVETRADIKPGTEAATKWHALMVDYEQATGRMAERRR